jgi:Tfp pilus assembly protein PilO
MTDKKRWIITIALSVLAAVGIGVLIYKQNQHIEENRQAAGLLRGTIDEYRELIQKTPELVKEVIVQRETDAVIKEILSDDQDVNNLVRTLQQFAEESNIVVTSLKKQRDVKSRRRTRQDFERVGYSLAFDSDVFQLMEFLDRVEGHSRFMSVSGFKLQAAARNDYGNEGGPRHRLQLDLETYVYVPTGNAKAAKIDHYERKRDLLISEISRRANELRVPVYNYGGSRGRRDPFIDPRVPVDQDGREVLTIEEQIAIVEGLIELTDEIEDLWVEAIDAPNLIAEMKARAQIDEKFAYLDEEIRRVEHNGDLTFVPAQRRFEKYVVQVSVDLRAQIADRSSGQGPSLAALRETADAMERHITSQEYELAIEAYDTLGGPGLALANEEELKQPLVRDLKQLRQLAETVIEFESIRLDIGGVAIYEDLRPVALINDQAVSEGELIGDELLVRKISMNQIEFSFRGLVLGRVVETGPTKSPH